jgi:hypothetical protein
MLILGFGLFIMNGERISLEFWFIVGSALKLQGAEMIRAGIQLGVDAVVPLFVTAGAVIELNSRRRAKSFARSRQIGRGGQE